MIDRLAATGNPRAFELPRPMLAQGFAFSFSGLKTAVAMAVAGRGDPPYPEGWLADLAASFQAAVVDTLVTKAMRAVEATRARALTLGGGVACKRELRARLEQVCAEQGVVLRIPSPRLCADNAAMVALLGAWQLARGQAGEAELDAVASLEESGLPVQRG